MQINYVNYLRNYVIKEDVPYEAAKEKIEVMYLDDNITLEEHDELLELADEVCSPYADLPENEVRISALEMDVRAIKERLGMISSDDWPLVEGARFSSAADFRHTGDRVSMLLDGELTVRHYVCKLNDKWEEQGTAYTPLGNAASWNEFSLDATEAEIEQYLATWKAKFPDFDGWVRDNE